MTNGLKGELRWKVCDVGNYGNMMLGVKILLNMIEILGKRGREDVCVCGG